MRDSYLANITRELESTPRTLRIHHRRCTVKCERLIKLINYRERAYTGKRITIK